MGIELALNKGCHVTYCPSFPSVPIIKDPDEMEGLICLRIPGYSSQLQGSHRGRNLKQHATCHPQGSTRKHRYLRHLSAYIQLAVFTLQQF